MTFVKQDKQSHLFIHNKEMTTNNFCLLTSLNISTYSEVIPLLKLLQDKQTHTQ